jgi:FAD/FMN-containing dehydrogenase/Fe-S oxidoreductase
MTRSDLTPERIGRELRQLVSGDVLTDELSRALYSTAACIFRMVPRAVVVPKHRQDVRAVVRYAAEHGIPITPRGAGSSLAGQALGTGIILDFTKYMNRIVEIDRDAGLARVQPGIVQAVLNRDVARYGLTFLPDPSSAEYCTIGGMVANNAGGAHFVKYGGTSDHVASLEVILADGTAMRTGVLAGEGQGGDATVREDAMLGGGALAREIAARLREIGEEKALLAWDISGRPRKNTSGYNLRDAFVDGTVDLTQLIIGSEGTLGIVTEAELALTPLPAVTGSALAYFRDLDSAGRAVEEILAFGPSRLEIVDNGFIELVRGEHGDYGGLLVDGSEAMLFIELEGDDSKGIRSGLSAVENRIKDELGLAFAVRVSLDRTEQEAIWELRNAALPIVHLRAGPTRPIPFIEDIVVHPKILPDYIRMLHRTLEKHGVESAIYGHAGDGDIHVRPFLDLRKASEVDRMLAIAEEVYDYAASVGAWPTGEHGDGILRTRYLERFFGPAYPLLGRIKQAFDPDGILNPGKILDTDPDLLRSNLRFSVGYPPARTDTRFDRPDVQREIEACHGCTLCRSVCPQFLELGDEVAAPRGKPNGLREMLATRERGLAFLGSEATDQLIETCFHCQNCLVACPTKVDVPRLVLELRAEAGARRGLPLANRLLGEARLLGALGARTAPLSNAMMGSGLVRAAMERITGIDRRREMPRFVRGTFLGRERGRQRGQRRGKGGGRGGGEGDAGGQDAGARDATERYAGGRYAVLPGAPEGEFRGERRVAYFVGCFANYYDLAVAEATVSLLRRHGITVILPEQGCCGIPHLVNGNRGRALREIGSTLGAFAGLAAEGVEIITSCPTCGLALRQEYLHQWDGDEAKVVAGQTYDIIEYLEEKVGLDVLLTGVGEGFGVEGEAGAPDEGGGLRDGVVASLGKESRVSGSGARSADEDAGSSGEEGTAADGGRLLFKTPCHLTAQAAAGPTRRVLERLGGRNLVDFEDSCCGLAGTFGFKRRHFDLSMQIGERLFREIEAAWPDLVVTNCGMCKIQIEQGTGRAVRHPVELVAEAADRAAERALRR